MDSYDKVVKATVTCVALALPEYPCPLLLNACHAGEADCESRLTVFKNLFENFRHSKVTNISFSVSRPLSKT